MEFSIDRIKEEIAAAEADLKQARAENGPNDPDTKEIERELASWRDAFKKLQLGEGYKPLELLKEMLQLDEAKKKPLKKAAKSVYHRDYMKTRNKPYRKYDKEDRKD